MKKNFIYALLLTLSSLLFVSCSATSNGNIDVQQMNYVHFKPMPLQKVHNLIKSAGEEDGWRMTEFKENKLIAEKIGSQQTEAVTVIFSKDYFELTPQNSDLQDAIEDKLGI